MLENMLTLAGGIALSVVVLLVFLAVVVYITFKVMTWLETRAWESVMDENETAVSQDTEGVTEVTVDRDSPFGRYLTAMIQNKVAQGEEDEAALNLAFPNTLPLQVGHYVAVCACPDCRNSAEHGGLSMDPFYDEYQLTADGAEVVRATTPISTCRCVHCRRARDAGVPNLTVGAARARLDALNKKWGYAL